MLGIVEVALVEDGEMSALLVFVLLVVPSCSGMMRTES